MKCRAGCAACCTVISISSPLPGMPNGKPDGVPCVNLDDNWHCKIHGTAEYPQVCRNFSADVFYCGNSNEEAHRIIKEIEEATKP